MRTLVYSIVLVFAISGCVGTDQIDEPKDPSVVVDITSLVLMVGESKSVEATYFYNMDRPEPDTQLFWESKDESIAGVNQEGSISGIAKGQTQVIVFNPGEDTATVMVTVVETELDVASVIISADKTSFNVGETIQLAATAYTSSNEEVSVDTFTWSSDMPSVVAVDASGLATAVSDGEAAITATVDGVSSQEIKLMVGLQSRSGNFQGAGSYNTSGTTTLFIDESGDLILELGENFETDFALGTFAYLANSTSGSVVRAQGLEVSEITGKGFHSFNISEIDASVTLDQYQYVIMLCKPASITFGSAELK